MEPHSWMRIELDKEILYFVDRYYYDKENKSYAMVKIDENNKYWDLCEKAFDSYQLSKPSYVKEYDNVQAYLKDVNHTELLQYQATIRGAKKKHEMWPLTFKMTYNGLQFIFRHISKGYSKRHGVVEIVIDNESFNNNRSFWENIYEKLSDDDKKQVEEKFKNKKTFINFMNNSISQKKLKECFHQSLTN